MTFPVPVDAVLCSLKARIDDRELVAVAAPREEARESYEVAIDSGRSAVLHEELIKGVHMLSVGRGRLDVLGLLVAERAHGRHRCDATADLDGERG
jgi:hypothetical protein